MKVCERKASSTGLYWAKLYYFIGSSKEMLFVDVHKPGKIQKYLADRTLIKVIRLVPGDYLCNGIAIERKTLSDFYASLKRTLKNWLYEKNVFF